MLALTAVALTSTATGCVHGAAAKGARADIARVEVTPYSLDPASRSTDFVLLRVKVNNPEKVRVKGVIACKADHWLEPSPIEYSFVLEAEKSGQFTFPIDRHKTFTYAARCRLRFRGQQSGVIREPNSWVEVQVPSPPPSTPGRGDLWSSPQDRAAHAMTQTRERE